MVGCLAAVFVSTDPTLLGHASWVATDVAAAAGFLAATYHGVRFLARSRRWWRAVVAGAAMGLALACKFSCVIAILALLLILFMRRPRALRRAKLRSFFHAWPRAAGVALLTSSLFFTLWATYFFDIGRLGDAIVMPGMPYWDSLPEWLKQTPIPMPSVVVGCLELARHNAQGHDAYFNGQLGPGGWWGYFPEAIALKSPAALLIGIAIALVAATLSPKGRRLPPRAAVLMVPLLLFMFVAMRAGINIGIRHVLPTIPLIYLIVVQIMARVRLAPLAAGLIVLAFVETGWRHPDYLAFFNVLAGGPHNGEKYLLDSNLDWGQDEARLARWLDQHAVGRAVTLRVFGNKRLEHWPHPSWDMVPPNESPRGLLAISKNVRHGLYPRFYRDEQGNWRPQRDVLGLEHLRPVARIGYSIEVYDLGRPQR
jgi:hypothetical protein